MAAGIPESKIEEIVPGDSPGRFHMADNAAHQSEIRALDQALASMGDTWNPRRLRIADFNYQFITMPPDPAIKGTGQTPVEGEQLSCVFQSLTTSRYSQPSAVELWATSATVVAVELNNLATPQAKADKD